MENNVREASLPEDAGKVKSIGLKDGKILIEIDAPDDFTIENLTEKVNEAGKSCGCSGGFVKSLGGFF